MNQSLKICLAQINLVVGDIDGSVQRVIQSAHKARDELGAHVIVYPELTLTGYPPEDLLLRDDFIAAAERELETVRASVRAVHCVIGHPKRQDGKLFNAASVLYDGKCLCTYHKEALPNYNVFDEVRYFTPDFEPSVFNLEGWTLGLSICEDVWEQAPIARSVAAGAEIILNLNACPSIFTNPASGRTRWLAPWPDSTPHPLCTPT